MVRTARISCAVLLAAIGLAAFAASDPAYTALRDARPDGRTIALSNFVYERDVLRFTLNGTLHLLPPVEGKTPGAVFTGQGSYELKPATPYEQRSLAINTGDDKLTALTDTFDSAIFLGTALPAAAEKASAPVAGTAAASAVDKWNDYLKKQKRDFQTNMHVRMLQEILNAEAEPYFFAWIDGKTHPPALLEVNPRDIEQTSMYVMHDSKGGLWYASRYKSEIDAGKAPFKPLLVDPEHYLIDTTIKGAELDATATMTFVPSVNLRVLPLSLFSKLRVSGASYATAADPATWTPVAWIQEDEKDDSGTAIVFPATLKQGEKYLLKMAYGGKDVLYNAGDGNFSVGARMSWYPNVSFFDDLAQFELRFRHPAKMQVVAVGNEVENKTEGQDVVALWKTANPLRVAGFNYGKFKKMTQNDKDSGMTVEVYTNPGTPDIIREINMILQATSEYAIATGDIDAMGPSHVKIDTASLAQSAMADAINTARTGNAYFGPLTDKRIAITQQSEWFFGQSWPSLVYLPYIAFLNGTQRNTLGLNGAKDFVDNVGAHELAHQWWGHQVGWATYRDQWLSEGFSEFTAALVLQQTAGWPGYNKYWERARKTILEKPRGAAITNDQAGPISQGFRNSTWQNRSAGEVIMYTKGAYVLHMLRMAMWDRQKGDETFMKMMREFASTYAGKNPSTRDFKLIVEKHATPNMRITTDGKVNWFFDQWVYGTHVPKIESKLDFKDAGGGKYKVTGTITQSQVPENFASVVPLYVQLDKTNTIRFGNHMIVGSKSEPVEFEISLPKKPQKFLVNVNHDILSR
jgi:Peptidase family M1 domain